MAEKQGRDCGPLRGQAAPGSLELDSYDDRRGGVDEHIGVFVPRSVFKRPTQDIHKTCINL
jgi:hypothetical protein